MRDSDDSSVQEISGAQWLFEWLRENEPDLFVELANEMREFELQIEHDIARSQRPAKRSRFELPEYSEEPAVPAGEEFAHDLKVDQNGFWCFEEVVYWLVDNLDGLLADRLIDDLRNAKVSVATALFLWGLFKNPYDEVLITADEEEELVLA